MIISYGTNRERGNIGELVEVDYDHSMTTELYYLDSSQNRATSTLSYQFTTVGNQIKLIPTYTEGNVTYASGSTSNVGRANMGNPSIANLMTASPRNPNPGVQHFGISSYYYWIDDEAYQVTIPWLTTKGLEWLEENTGAFYWYANFINDADPTIAEKEYEILIPWGIQEVSGNYQPIKHTRTYKGLQYSSAYTNATISAGQGFEVWGNASNYWKTVTLNEENNQFIYQPLGLLWEKQEEIHWDIIDEINNGQWEFRIFTTGWKESTETYAQGYANGLEDGYSQGRTQGYSEGYNQGLEEGSANNGFTGPFALLGQAFESTAGLMQTEIFPHITIGSLIFVPIAVSVIIAIFKMIKR